MFIRNLNALQTVNALDFSQQVRLYALHASDLQNVMRIDGSLCQLVAGFDHVALLHFHLAAERDQIGLCFSVVVRDDRLTAFLALVDMDRAADLRDDSEALRFSCFEQFLDTGKTLCDILCSSDAARMECTHRQLRSGFADSLCGDNADCLADVDRIAGGKVRAVALRTDAGFASACEDAPAGDALHAGFFDRFRLIVGDHLVFLHNDLAGLRIDDRINRVTADDPALQRFNQLASVADLADDHSLRGFAALRKAVILADDHFLRDIDKTSGQITGVSRTKRRIR